MTDESKDIEAADETVEVSALQLQNEITESVVGQAFVFLFEPLTEQNDMLRDGLRKVLRSQKLQLAVSRAEKALSKFKGTPQISELETPDYGVSFVGDEISLTGITGTYLQQIAKDRWPKQFEAITEQNELMAAALREITRANSIGYAKDVASDALSLLPMPESDE